LRPVAFVVFVVFSVFCLLAFRRVRRAGAAVCGMATSFRLSQFYLRKVTLDTLTTNVELAMQG